MVDHKGSNVIDVPVWVLIVAVLFAFWPVCVILIVGLFCDCRYSIEGKDDAGKINDVLDKAGDAVDKVKEEIDKL